MTLHNLLRFFGISRGSLQSRDNARGARGLLFSTTDLDNCFLDYIGHEQNMTSKKKAISRILVPKIFGEKTCISNSVKSSTITGGPIQFAKSN